VTRSIAREQHKMTPHLRKCGSFDQGSQDFHAGDATPFKRKHAAAAISSRNGSVDWTPSALMRCNIMTFLRETFIEEIFLDAIANANRELHPRGRSAPDDRAPELAAASGLQDAGAKAAWPASALRASAGLGARRGLIRVLPTPDKQP
jgi:hypothetical protein